MLKVPCKCGGDLTHKVGDVKHQIGNKNIVVKNVPHYYCDKCHTSSYDSNVNVSRFLKKAINNGLDEIQYKE